MGLSKSSSRFSILLSSTMHPAPLYSSSQFLAVKPSKTVWTSSQSELRSLMRSDKAFAASTRLKRSRSRRGRVLLAPKAPYIQQVLDPIDRIGSMESAPRVPKVAPHTGGFAARSPPQGISPAQQQSSGLTLLESKS